MTSPYQAQQPFNAGQLLSGAVRPRDLQAEKHNHDDQIADEKPQ